MKKKKKKLYDYLTANQKYILYNHKKDIEFVLNWMFTIGGYLGVGYILEQLWYIFFDTNPLYVSIPLLLIYVSYKCLRKFYPILFIARPPLLYKKPYKDLFDGVFLICVLFISVLAFIYGYSIYYTILLALVLYLILTYI